MEERSRVFWSAFEHLFMLGIGMGVVGGEGVFTLIQSGYVPVSACGEPIPQASLLWA